jgi:hypothetical protein
VFIVVMEAYHVHQYNRTKNVANRIQLRKIRKWLIFQKVLPLY